MTTPEAVILSSGKIAAHSGWAMKVQALKLGRAWIDQPQRRPDSRSRSCRATGKPVTLLGFQSWGSGASGQSRIQRGGEVLQAVPAPPHGPGRTVERHPEEGMRFWSITEP